MCVLTNLLTNQGDSSLLCCLRVSAQCVCVEILIPDCDLNAAQ